MTATRCCNPFGICRLRSLLRSVVARTLSDAIVRSPLPLLRSATASGHLPSDRPLRIIIRRRLSVRHHAKWIVWS